VPAIAEWFGRPGAASPGLGGRLLVWLVAALTSVPLVVVFSAFLSPADEVWQHLASTILGELVFNTLTLAVAVAAGTGLIGVGLAWLIAVCEFPGRRFFSWALLLPLALPAYVLAFVFIGLFDYTGPVQTGLRELAGGNLPWFPEVRSRGGVYLVMTLALYPYVYLLARNAFRTQGRRMLEAGRSLGLSRAGAFWRVALPMARPWIAAGMALVLMETLADFGTVAVFNYDTLTTGVYKAWFGLFSLAAACQVASVLVLIAFVALVLEQQSRARLRYAPSHAGAEATRLPLHGWHAAAAACACALVVAIAFVLPITQLALWAAAVAGEALDSRYLGYLWRTLALAAIAAFAVALLSLLLAYAARREQGFGTQAALRIATLGYAVPGAVLAVGIFVALAKLDEAVPQWIRDLIGMPAGALIQGSLWAMLIAYVIRFLAVGFGPIESASHRITRNMEEAAVLLGQSGWRLLTRVHMPIVRHGIATCMVLVFVDVMKEMPITLMTRPFGWDTLAVRIFELTSEGQWQLAALPAVALVLAGVFPLMRLTRSAD
jgi:iron(III) transport system permease protein